MAGSVYALPGEPVPTFKAASLHRIEHLGRCVDPNPKNYKVVKDVVRFVFKHQVPSID
jgi:hypothetical protein